MALLITITDAGRAEIINADNTGTGPVVITEIGFGTGQYAPSKAQTALTNEVKRVSSIAGQAVAADTIHVTAKDEGQDAYNVGEFGLYSAAGTLVAVYSQAPAAGWIIQKAGASTLLLAVDIILESLDAASLSFGDITFLNPPATTETPGVVALENSLTSPSTTKALTAAQGKKLQDEKEPAFAAGTTAQYRRGDKTWQDLAAAVRAVVMTGLSTATSTAVAAADSLLVAIGKLQAQITGLNNSKLDATANAVSASKLVTPRTIGGVSFDGTANINLPGVNATGNQSTTGNAGTATKLATARAINGVNFDGTANITVADATKLPLAGGTMGTSAAVIFNHPTATQYVSHRWNKVGVIRAAMGSEPNASWNVWTYNSSGVFQAALNFADTGVLTAPFFNGDGSGLTALDASNLGSGTLPDARLSGTYTGVSITGNAATATALQTARTINGVSFNGTANITVADATKLPLTGGTISKAGQVGFGTAALNVNSTGVAGQNAVLGFATNSGGAAIVHDDGVNGLRIESTTPGAPANLYLANLYASGEIAPISGVTFNAPDLGDSWERGHAYKNGATLLGGIGGLGTASALTNVYMAVGASPWVQGYGLRVSATGIQVEGPVTLTNSSKIAPQSTAERQAGMYGVYDTTKTSHVWSMGTPYAIPPDGSTFGNLYGIAYKHTANLTGGTMAGGHQIVFCSGGAPGAAIGLAGNIWTSGLTETGALKVNGSTTLLTGTLLDGTSNGLKITNGANGTVEIGNRNASYTHYGSSTGSHYFYGNVTVESSLTIIGTSNAPTAAAGTSTSQLATTAFVQAAIGTGAVQFFAGSTAPTGWLKANGAAISRTSYPTLFAAIGTTFGAGNGSTTFNLPDMRGEFPRGWDDGRGADSGRAFGSAQSELTRYSRLTQVRQTGAAAAATRAVPEEGESLGVYVDGHSISGPYGLQFTNTAQGAETRPRNIALLACIKY